jgi:hypothetical protein
MMLATSFIVFAMINLSGIVSGATASFTWLTATLEPYVKDSIIQSFVASALQKAYGSESEALSITTGILSAVTGISVFKVLYSIKTVNQLFSTIGSIVKATGGQADAPAPAPAPAARGRRNSVGAGAGAQAPAVAPAQAPAGGGAAAAFGSMIYNALGNLTDLVLTLTFLVLFGFYTQR